MNEADRWIGWRLRERRKTLLLSIKELSNKVGLSVGMISQVERGLSNPSLRSLRLLASALDVPVSWFFEATPGDASDSYVIRHNRRRKRDFQDTGTLEELRSSDWPSQLELYEFSFNPGAESSNGTYFHAGEKAGFILSGELHLWIADHTYVLKEGDSFHFPSTLPHMFRNPSDKIVKMVWIVLSNSPKEFVAT